MGWVWLPSYSAHSPSPQPEFLSDPGIPGVRSIGPSLSKLRDVWLDLTDVTLADEDMQVMQVMQVTQVMQVMQVKQFLQVMQVIQDRIYTEKVTISCCAIWWPNL